MCALEEKALFLKLFYQSQQKSVAAAKEFHHVNQIRRHSVFCSCRAQLRKECTQDPMCVRVCILNHPKNVNIFHELKYFMWLDLGIRPIVRMWNLGLWGSALRGALSKGS